MSPERPPMRIWTIPNAISFIRFLGVPLFLWLVLVQENDVAAFVVLALAGASDWVDGYLARLLNQRSRVGELLDPLVDRLYIAATLAGLALRGFIPWWLVIVIAARDVLLLATIPVLRRVRLAALPVTYVGKAGTFALLFGFPGFLLTGLVEPIGVAFGALAWAFTLWGVYLYWWAGIRYVQTARALIKNDCAPR